MAAGEPANFTYKRNDSAKSMLSPRSRFQGPIQGGMLLSPLILDLSGDIFGFRLLLCHRNQLSSCAPHQRAAGSDKPRPRHRKELTRKRRLIEKQMMTF